MILSGEVPPRLSALAIHPLVDVAKPATVRVLHCATCHRRAEEFENLGVKLRCSVIRQVDNVGKDQVGSGHGTEKRGFVETHQSVESIVGVSCEKIIKG